MTKNNIKELPDLLDKYGIEYEVVGDSVIAEKVDLANRSISKLPESIGKLKCEVLWLNHNKLTSLPDSFGDIKCKELGLQYNQLTSLPNSIVNLKCDLLYLYDNPLPSKLQHLFNKLKRNGVNVIYFYKQTKQEIPMECIKTEVKHSLSKHAWNVVGTQLGVKYKIARVPYIVIEGNEILTTRNKHEALEHALFISRCFNEKQGI